MASTNAASRRVAERAGFTFEGLLRRDTLGVDGQPRDTLVYSRVRGVEEPESRRPSATRPARSGRPRRSRCRRCRCQQFAGTRLHR